MEPKYDWSINGLAYGSNLLIKLDIVDTLRTQYEKFEYHFRNNEKVIHDLKIPLLVMEIFSKFWKLWIDFPELRGAIPRNSFYNLYKEMSSFFETEKNQPNETFLLCETMHLAGLVETLQPTPTLATVRHMSLCEFQVPDPHPVEPKIPLAASQNFNLIDLSESPVEVTSSIPTFTVNPGIGEKPCNSSLVSGNLKDAQNTTQDLSDAMSPSSTLEPVVNIDEESLRFFKLPTPDDTRCGPCCREVKDESIETHLLSAKHRKQRTMMMDCVYHLQKNKSAVSIKCERTMQFECGICHIMQVGANCLIQHCKSRLHSNRMSKKQSTA